MKGYPHLVMYLAFEAIQTSFCLQVQLTSKIIDEDQVMVFLNSDKIIPMIHAQLYRDSDTASTELDLVSWVDSIKSVFGDKKLTLLIYDLDRYFRYVH